MSKVYFAKAASRSHQESKIAKVARLCDMVGLENIIEKDQLTAVKLHFGEYGNDGYIRPPFVRMVIDKIKALGGKPFLTDTATLYSGSRSNAVDHLETAFGHGFVPSVVNAPVIIADGLDGTNDEAVRVDLPRLKETYIAKEIIKAPAMVVLSHFKGHEMAGFGGAIKNLAMGCASVRGKRAQHDTKVSTNAEKCIGCGMCEQICPQDAAKVGENGTATIDAAKCIGCFECITVCQPKAIEMDWMTELPPFMERLTEYAYGAVKGKQDKTVYINFALNITPDCDCAAWSDAPLVPDIGILASTDPVALDQACHDLVTAAQGLHCCEHSHANPGIDKFQARWQHTVGTVQLSHGEKIGLGSRQYELIEI